MAFTRLVATFAAVFVVCSYASKPVTQCPSDSVRIATGVCMPFCSDGDVMHHTPSINDTTAALRWIAAGGRGLDTAWTYDHGGYGHSQRDMGLAIQQSGVAREDIFVTTKIPCGADAASVAALIEYDLDQLMLSQVDLLLIHHPTSPLCNSSDQIALTWAAMQGALAKNLSRAIGVSNFKSSDLNALMDASTTTVTPAVNQIMLHVDSVDKDTIAWCAAHNVTVEAYSPLGHPDNGGAPVYNLTQVVQIAKSHNVTGAQVALRWLVQQGFPFVTASGTTEYDKEDLGVFSFELTAAEMDTLNSL